MIRTPHPVSVKTLASRLKAWLLTRQVEMVIRPFLGPPPVLERNVQPPMGRRVADSLHQLPLLNHGRGTATSVKWFV